MITNKDIDECLVRAEYEVDEMIDAALREFYRPDVEREAEMMMASLPETLRQMVEDRLQVRGG